MAMILETRAFNYMVKNTVLLANMYFFHEYPVLRKKILIAVALFWFPSVNISTIINHD